MLPFVTKLLDQLSQAAIFLENNPLGAVFLVGLTGLNAVTSTNAQPNDLFHLPPRFALPFRLSIDCFFVLIR